MGGRAVSVGDKVGDAGLIPDCEAESTHWPNGGIDVGLDVGTAVAAVGNAVGTAVVGAGEGAESSGILKCVGAKLGATVGDATSAARGVGRIRWTRASFDNRSFH